MLSRLHGASQAWSPVALVSCSLYRPFFSWSRRQPKSLIFPDSRRGVEGGPKQDVQTEIENRDIQGFLDAEDPPTALQGPEGGGAGSLEATVWLWAHLRKLFLGPVVQGGWALTLQDLQISRDFVHWTGESQRWCAYPVEVGVLQNILLNMRPPQSSYRPEGALHGVSWEPISDILGSDCI